MFPSTVSVVNYFQYIMLFLLGNITNSFLFEVLRVPLFVIQSNFKIYLQTTKQLESFLLIHLKFLFKTVWKLSYMTGSLAAMTIYYGKAWNAMKGCLIVFLYYKRLSFQAQSLKVCLILCFNKLKPTFLSLQLFYNSLGIQPLVKNI